MNLTILAWYVSGWWEKVFQKEIQKESFTNDINVHFSQLLLDNNTLWEGGISFTNRANSYLNIWYLNTNEKDRYPSDYWNQVVTVYDKKIVNNITTYNVTEPWYDDPDDTLSMTGWISFQLRKGYLSSNCFGYKALFYPNPNNFYNNTPTIQFHSTLNYVYGLEEGGLSSFYFRVYSFNVDDNRYMSSQRISQYSLGSDYNDLLQEYQGISLFERLKDDVFLLLGGSFVADKNPFFRILHLNSNFEVDLDINISSINEGSSGRFSPTSYITKVNDYQNDPVWIIFGNFSYSSNNDPRIIIKYFPNGLYDSNYNLKSYETNPSGCEVLFQSTDDFEHAPYVFANKNFTKIILSNAYSQSDEIFYYFHYYQISSKGIWYEVTNQNELYKDDTFLPNLFKNNPRLVNTFAPNSDVSHTFTYRQFNSDSTMLYVYDLVWNEY